LIEKSSNLLTDLKNQMDESALAILLEWEAAVQYQHSANGQGYLHTSESAPLHD
jgi:hypothetical protein